MRTVTRRVSTRQCLGFLSLLLAVLWGCGPADRPVDETAGADRTRPPSEIQPGSKPGDKDLRIGYRLASEEFWGSVDSLRLVVDSVVAYHRPSAKSCDTGDVLSMLVNGTRPTPDGAGFYEFVPRMDTLELSNAVRHQVLPLDVLNGLPDGYLFYLRLRIREVIVTTGGRERALAVPPRWQMLGAPIRIDRRFAPVCGDYITSLVVQFDPSLFQVGPMGMELRGGDLRAELTAPAAVTPTLGGRTEVPAAAWVQVPPQAVNEPFLLRLAQVPQVEVVSSDPLLARTAAQVGAIFDFKPDAQYFTAPVEMALDTPHQYEVTRDTIDALTARGVPGPVLSLLYPLLGRVTFGERAFVELVRETLADSASYLYLVVKESPRAPRFAPQRLAMFTYTPRYGVWTPDVPKLVREHQELVIAELDRVIAAKEASSNLVDHFPPDFSRVPSEPYEGLELEEINRREQDGYLVTLSNHFCAKSLFVDLEDPNTDNNDDLYQPLLDGALDHMCQADLYGWAIDSNDDVHCGHHLPSEADFRQANRQTRRVIDTNGIALRLRNNRTRDYFSSLGCPAANSAAYCYDARDFEDDLRWAIEMWREAINRNPDGTYTERFDINCWEFVDEDSNCSGDEIDVNIRSMAEWAYSSGKNITLSEDLVDDAIASLDGRVELRHTVLHELGHVVGLHHWAGPGTLMSFFGRDRRNDHRENTCAPYTQAQWQAAGNPSSLAAGLVSDCEVDVYHGHPGTTTLAWNHRLAKLSCTEVQRIRNQINDGAEWARCEPLQCELLTQQTEYSALELPEYDSATNEYYTVLDFDLAFAHCGSAAEFEDLELEIFPVDADNTLADVINLHDGIVEMAAPAVDASGIYTIRVRLDSRNLVGATPTVGSLVTSVPSFSEYVQGSNAANRRYPNLAMVLRAYEDTDGSGALDRFLAASTGLLRSPILDPVATPITLGVEDMEKDGVSVATEALREEFEDFVSGPDLYPYIDDALRKPNVGRVLYVTVPPRDRDFEGDEYADENYKLRFAWSILDGQLEGGPLGPARVWIDSIAVTREKLPVVSDWTTAGGVVSSTAVSTPESLVYAGVHTDPCQHTSGEVTLPALRDQPVYDMTLASGEEVEVWDLLHLAVRFDLVHYTNSATGAACTAADVCDPSAGCVPGPLTSARTEDFYVSIAGPTGAVTKPLGIDSLCLIQASTSGQSYEVAAQVEGLAMLPELFPGHEFQIRLHGIGEVRGGRAETQATAWTNVDDLPPDGTLRLSATWNNNENDHDYNVTLRYQHKLEDDPDWSDEVILDKLDLRIDSSNDCDDGPITYDRVCSLVDDDYPCDAGT